MLRQKFNVACVAATLLVSVAAVAEPTPPTVTVAGCKVYTEAQSVDCTKTAAAVCDGKAFCELPIGKNLSDGKPLVSKQFPGGWAKVVVDYKCGAASNKNGPHEQNDHATMTLACGHR